MGTGMDKAKPTPIALVICDNVYRESGGKTALVGLFNRIQAAQFPTRHSRICAYVSVTSARPGDIFKLEVVHSETDELVFRAEGPAPNNVSPVGICDFVFQINNLVFEEPALYYIRFWGNDHLLLQRPFTVAKREEKKPG